MAGLGTDRVTARVPAARFFGAATSAILEPDVGVETVHAALAPEARFLVAAERGGRVEPIERVRPDDARLHLPGHPQDPAALLRPHAGGKAVRRVVGLLDGLV